MFSVHNVLHVQGVICSFDDHQPACHSAVTQVPSSSRYPATYVTSKFLDNAQEKFIHLLNSGTANTLFSSMPLSLLWIKCLDEYLILSETVLCLLLPPVCASCERDPVTRLFGGFAKNESKVSKNKHFEQNR